MAFGSRRAVRLLLFFLVYFAAAEAGFWLASLAGGTLSPVWPASGLALAALCLGGPFLWPAVAMGVLLAGYLNGMPLGMALGVAAGNALEALVGERILRWHGFRPARGGLLEAQTLVLRAAPLAAMVGAFVGSLALGAGGGEMLRTFGSWLVGDLISILVLTPAIFSWGLERDEGFRRRPVEAFLVGIAVVASAFLVFGHDLVGYPMAFLVFPPVIWSAFRFGRRGASLAVVAVALISVGHTYLGFGPFAVRNVGTDMVFLQLFTGALALSAILLSAATTDLLHVGRDLRVTRRLHEDLLANSTAAIYVKDLEGRYLMVNGEFERAVGLGRDRILGRTDGEIFPEAVARELQVTDRRVQESRRSLQLEERIEIRGQHRHFLSNKFPLFHHYLDRQGPGRHGRERLRIYAVCGISSEITGQKLAEDANVKLLAELRAAVLVRDEFLSIASHELRTPLTPLRIQMQTIRRLVDSGEIHRTPLSRLKALLDNSERQFDRLSRLIEELLDASRIATGRLSMQYEEFDLQEVISSLVRFSERQFNEAGSRLEFSSSGTPVWVCWDRVRIEQVFLNFLSNALKFGSGRPVGIRLAAKGDEVLLEVRDQGIGIAPEDQKRIFERYERAISSQTYGGLGLGLYVARLIVEAHHGKIGVISEMGKGSVFYFRAPRLLRAHGDAEGSVAA